MSVLRHSKEHLTQSPEQTKELGKKIGSEILKQEPPQGAQVLGLVGELGSGKTCFLQGFAKGLGVKEKILSPTYVIMKKFPIPPVTCHLSPETFVHIDCYRIDKPKEILDLGFKQIVSNPENIVAIEWAGRIEQILPQDCLILEFEISDKNQRKIVLK